LRIDKIQPLEPRLHQEERPPSHLLNPHERARETHSRRYQLPRKNTAQSRTHQTHQKFLNHLSHLPRDVPGQVQGEGLCLPETVRGGMPIPRPQWKSRTL